jgi:quercetin dioxygenase-like cupin family protein
MGTEDEGARILGTAPPANGTRFCVIELQPGSAYHGQHRTDTLDYVLCLSGQVVMPMDDTEIMLDAGDVLIQRGTNHAWVNRTDRLARIAFVLIDGQPKRSGSLAGGTNAR